MILQYYLIYLFSFSLFLIIFHAMFSYFLSFPFFLCSLLFLGQERNGRIHHKFITFRSIILLLQSTIGSQHIFESGVETQPTNVPPISTTPLWPASCQLIYDPCNHHQSICNDWTSEDIPEVSVSQC